MARPLREELGSHGRGRELVAGRIDRDDPALIDRLFEWPRARSRWKRRAAAVALIQEAKSGRHTEAIFKMAEMLFPDEDDMVRKGVGWLLKETYPKRPESTVEFLRERHSQISRLTLRYAAEKMTLQDKRHAGL